MKEALLRGVRVIDLAGEPLAMTGRILADLGAEVIKIEPKGGDPLRSALPLDNNTGESLRFQAWNAGKLSIELSSSNFEEALQSADVVELLSGADAVIETPGFLGALELPVSYAAQAVWLKATPFGLEGPRGSWQGSDLGILAASGNLFVTGFADRGPVRCAEPAAYAHAGAEAAFAILTGLATGRTQMIDLSMQEAVMVANMGAIGQFPKTKNKGHRMGAHMGKTREIWPCKDGYVSFGLRGGPARVRNYEILNEEFKKEGLENAAWAQRDWATFNALEISDEELKAIEAPLFELFSRYTMSQLYELAARTNLMLASANSPKEIYHSAQFVAREMFAPLDGIDKFPRRFLIARAADNSVAAAQANKPSPKLACGPVPSWHKRKGALSAFAESGSCSADAAWKGLKLVEFGAGAAGPIASRYFAEHGATVIKVESRSRPEFLRMMAIRSPHKLEGSTLFDALNAGKRSITVNLKTEGGLLVAKRLILWADAVQENFAPKVMRGFGLDYDTLVQEKPDLVMLSTCLNGQTGPHRDYPGFGGQGAALSGYNFLTGWPDTEPVGPYGTITDSLAPKFCATALAAALFYRRRTGKGVYLDISQVEAAAFCLSPWLLDYSVNGHVAERMGNRSLQAAPHGVFPCQETGSWIAIACWTERQWLVLARLIGQDPHKYPSLQSRFDAQNEIEHAITCWTEQQSVQTLAQLLQAQGVEAVPVASFEQVLNNDQQLQHRQHFVKMQRPVTGESLYERNSFRLSDAPSVYQRHSPTLGENNDEILREMLGFSPLEVETLKETGAVE